MKKIRKTYSGVVPNGKVLNSRNNSQQDTYSSDYLNRTIPDTNDLGNIIVDDVICKNILPNNIQSQTINGVTITKGEDGSLTLNGTFSTYTKFVIASNLEIKAGTYIFYFSEEGTLSGECYGAVRDANSNVVGKDLQIHKAIKTNSFSLNETKELTINVAFGTGAIVTNFKIYPMLEKSPIATGYIPHKEFSNKQIYTTSEQLIGTWLDKPLYRKVINFGALPNTTSKSVAHNISNIDYIVDIRATAALPGGDTMKLDVSDKDGLKFSVHISANNTNITVLTGSDRSVFTRCYVTLEYTKTTD